MEDKKLIGHLQDLIATPSVNPMGQDLSGDLYSTRNIVDLIGNRLKKIGFDIKVCAHHPDHPSLVAYLNTGSKETIVLDSHLDTVSHLNMSVNPFDPVLDHERLYGRGSCDTKATMATYIAVVEDLLKHGKKITSNVIITGCSQEESSFGGIKHVVENGLKADYAIVGEPTELKGLNSHKGVYRCYITSKGRASHSAFPHLGINAIYLISEAVLRLQALAEELKNKKHHKVLGHPTLSVGTIQGGTTVNTVPPAAKIEIDRRLIPGESTEEVHAELVQCLEGLEGIEVEPANVSSSGFEESLTSHVCQHLKHASESCLGNFEFMQAAYATHAPFYQSIGIPSIVFGPGSIEQAHTENEYVPLDELKNAAKIIEQLLISA